MRVFQRPVRGDVSPKRMTTRTTLITMTGIVCCTLAGCQTTPSRSDQALLAAVEKSDLKQVVAALEDGASPNAREREWGFRTPVLLTASRSDDVDIVRHLLDAGADVNATQSFGQNALLWAAERGNLQTVDLLLERGAQIEPPVLHVAAREGHTGVVEKLIDAGADVDATWSCGNTALMWAAEEDHADTVRLLVARGADMKLRDDAGESAGDTAAKKGNTNIVRILREAGQQAESTVPVKAVPSASPLVR